MAKRKLPKRLAAKAAHYRRLNLARFSTATAPVRTNALLPGVDSAIAAACKAFKLNYADANHRDFLLSILAAEYFGAPSGKSKGRPVVWTKEKLDKLAEHVRRFEGFCARNKHKFPAGEDAAFIIKFVFRDDYTGPNYVSPGELARYILRIRKNAI